MLRFGYVTLGMEPFDAVEHGALAEKMGFYSVWVPDHFVDIDGDTLEPWTVLSAIAARTKRIRLGSAVTDTQRSHPARTAHLVVSLDSISHGRAILGLGAGEAMNIIPYGLPWEPPLERVARLKEAIQVIRLLWTSSRVERANVRGKFYCLNRAFLSQRPKMKPYPSIYVGALGSRSALKLVGEMGDGWYAWLNTPETFRKRWSTIVRAAESVRRNPRLIESVSQLMVAFPRNSKEKKAAMQVAKATLLVEKTLLASLGHQTNAQPCHYQNLVVSKGAMEKILKAARGVPDDAVYRTMAIDGKRDVEEKIEALAKAGLKHIVFGDLLTSRRSKRTMRSLQDIIKKFK